MISWLQLNLQKHFRVVFIVLLVVMTFSLIYAIGNQGNFMGGNRGGIEGRRFFETSLDTPAKIAQFNQDAQLSGFLGGNMRVNPSYRFERATALHIANIHNLPGPAPAQLEEFVKTRPIFMGAGGAFDAQTYNMMLDNLQLGGGATESDIARILSDDYKVEKVYDLLQGPGFLSEEEIIDTLRQRSMRYSVLTASLDLTTYNPTVDYTDEQLLEYYESFGFNYETPVRRSVDYIEFDAADFVDEIKPDEDALINYFEANISRYEPTPVEPAEGEEAVETEPVTFESVRSLVRTQYRLEKARDLATEKGIDFLKSIIDQQIKGDSPELESAIEALSLEKKTTTKFAANETPIGTTWGPNLVGQAFLLSEGNFHSEPIQHGNKSIIMFYDEEIPSVIPSFETLRERIARDYTQEKLRELRVTHGTEVQASLAENTDSETVFGAFAEESGLTVSNYNDFTLMEPAEGLSARLFNTIIELDVSEVSDMIKLSENEGVFVFLFSKEAEEVSADSENYQQVKDSMLNQYHRFSIAQYIQKLMIAEAERAQINPFAAN